MNRKTRAILRLIRAWLESPPASWRLPWIGRAGDLLELLPRPGRFRPREKKRAVIGVLRVTRHAPLALRIVALRRCREIKKRRTRGQPIAARPGVRRF